MLRKATPIAAALVITAFFAVMWGVMLRRHLSVRAAAQFRPDYSNLLKPGEQERSTNWGIYFGGFRIGRSQMTVKRESEGTIVLRTQARVSISQALKYVVGVAGDLDLDFRASISPLRGLIFFQATSGLLKADLQGTVRRNELLLNGHVGENRIRTSVPYDQDRLWGEALSPLAALPELGDDQVGRTWSFDMVNPIAGAVQPVTVEVARSVEVRIKGEAVEVYELRFSTGSSRWTSWVTEAGEVLVQGTPFGLALQREDLPPSVLAELKAEAALPSASQ